MGTDEAPGTEVAGALDAFRDHGSELEILLVGDAKLVEDELSRASDYPRDRVTVVHAPERILPGDSPALAVRRKARSSIVMGLRLQKEGKADAFVSAGSTGAVMAASLIILRRLPGVDRPAIGTLLPTSGLPTLMLDAGANVDCKPDHLLQFAKLGKIYAQDIMGVENPRVGLLNIGEEPEKGDEQALEAYRLLSDSGLHFIGNVEGRDIIGGVCDVLVCDGFVGNVLLKFYESVAEFVIGLLRRELAHSRDRLELEEVFQVLDYAEYGGAPLLGVNGVSIVCHGKSPPKAIRNAVGVAAEAVRSSMVSHVARELSDGSLREELV
jgi:glycerol-3-phosphate acyltransferase PlsX